MSTDTQSTRFRTDPAFKTFSAAAAVMILFYAILGDLIPSWVTYGLLAVGVAFLGLPHGALDGILLRNSAFWQKRFAWLRFHLLYLVLAVAVVIAWWQAPVVGLTVFLIISAVHFGGDFKPSPRPLQWLAGAWLLLLPIGFHTSAVSDLFVVLSGPEAAELARLLALPIPVLVLGGLMISLFLSKTRILLPVEIGLLLLLAWATPPLVYFTVYFCCLHSLRHFHRSWRHMPRDWRGRMRQEVVVYTLLTLLAAAMVGIWLSTGVEADALLMKLVFIGLAALTVPHMLILSWAGPPPADCERNAD